MFYSLCTLLRANHTPKAVPTQACTHSKFRESFANLAQTEFIILQQSGGRPRLKPWELDQRAAALTQVKIRIECAKSASRSISAASSIHQQARPTEQRCFIASLFYCLRRLTVCVDTKKWQSLAIKECDQSFDSAYVHTNRKSFSPALSYNFICRPRAERTTPQLTSSLWHSYSIVARWLHARSLSLYVSGSSAKKLLLNSPAQIADASIRKYCLLSALVQRMLLIDGSNGRLNYKFIVRRWFLF